MRCMDILPTSIVSLENLHLFIDCEQWHWSGVSLLWYGVQDWGLVVCAWIVKCRREQMHM